MAGRAKGAVVYERGSVWWVRFSVGGKQDKQTTGVAVTEGGDRNRAKAQAAGDAIYGRCLQVGAVQPRRRPGPVASDGVLALAEKFADHTRDSGKSEGYVSLMTIHLGTVGGIYPRLDQLASTKAIEEYAARRGRPRDRNGDGMSSVTVVKELNTIRRFLRWCKVQGLIAEIPDFESPRQRPTRVIPLLKPDEVAAFLGKLPERSRGLPARSAVTWLWSQAFRKSEAWAIERRDVDLEAGTVTVRPEVDKNGLRWLLPLTTEARAVLDGVLDRASATGPIFPVTDLRGSFETARVAAGLPHFGPHALRHARISEWANGTKKLASVQFMARHTNISTTAKYVHADTAQARTMLLDFEDDDE